MTTPGAADAVALAKGAARAGLGLKLLGGLAGRVLCPGFPPRLRAGQDMDFACLSKERKKVAAYLAESGCEGDRRFNNLNGDRQMYFTAPSGRPVDVMVDRLTMCHTLDLRPSFTRLPITIDAIDVLLSKLQIIEINLKDAHDIVHLLSGLPVAGDSGSVAGAAEGAMAGAASPGAAAAPGPAALDTDRFCRLLGADWGWWRTATRNLEKVPALIAEHPDLVPPDPPADPAAQAGRRLDHAEQAPKSVKWRLRSNVGERVRWYELPEEVAH